MQRNRFTGLNGNGFHGIDHRSLVGLRRFVHYLHVDSVAQPFRVGHGQAEHQVLVAGHGRYAEAGFRFGAVRQGHDGAGNLRPFIGQRIAVLVAGG